MGGKIPGRIKKDLRGRIKRAKKIIFFLDYDGTLTPIRKKPGLAKLNRNTKAVLKKIIREVWADIFIISGRTLKNIKSLIGLKGLSYSGNHGIELEGPRLRYINPTARAMRPYIQSCYRTLRKKLRIKGAILENKFYTLSVHYRIVAPGSVGRLKKIFRTAVKSLRKNKKIKITEGKKVLEVRPNIKWHKGKVLNLILKRIKTKKSLPIYIGDDITDEDAFKALGKKGISILVSKKRRRTAAGYRLKSAKEVLNLLEFILAKKNEPLDTKS